MSGTEQFCTFYLDQYFFGVPVRHVQEVLRFHEMTPVPLAPPVIRGLINLRGDIVTAIDLRTRLALPVGPEEAAPLNVIIRTGQEVVSLLVDKIGDVLLLGEDSFEPPPETLEGVIRDLLVGVYKLQDRLLLVLDTDKAVDV